MKYLKVHWIHDLMDEPVLLHSELDAERCETPKLEEHADGRRDLASRNGRTGSTYLSGEPVPDLDTINSHAEFRAEEISADEFEQIWFDASRRWRIPK